MPTETNIPPLLISQKLHRAEKIHPQRTKQLGEIEKTAIPTGNKDLGINM